MKRAVIITMIMTPSAASAGDVCTLGQAVTNCFHPTARYQECEVIGRDTGRARFSGGLTGRPYSLSYRVETKDSFARVVLLDDNAAIPPNKSCSMASWQPMKRAE